MTDLDAAQISGVMGGTTAGDVFDAALGGTVGFLAARVRALSTQLEWHRPLRHGEVMSGNVMLRRAQLAHRAMWWLTGGGAVAGAAVGHTLSRE